MTFHSINVLFRVMCARTSTLFRNKQSQNSNNDIDILPHRILMLQKVFPDGNTQIVVCNLDRVVLESNNCKINIRYANGVTKRITIE